MTSTILAALFLTIVILALLLMILTDKVRPEDRSD